MIFIGHLSRARICHCAFIILSSLLCACTAADQLPAVDLFNTGENEWHLAFRGTAFIQQPVYDAYLHGSENVDAACKDTDPGLPCFSHYRSSILDNWKDIEEVAFAIYQSGTIRKFAIFDGRGTDYLNWFSAGKLKSSSWPDLKGQPQFFSIPGDGSTIRRFFINHNYDGCANDAGWFVAVDQANANCQWEDEEAFPVFLYADSDSYENWTNGKYSQADTIAVYVKYRKIEQLAFVDLFGSGQAEWRLVFRGTSHIGQSVYDAYFHGSENVDSACKQTDGSIPCTSHYRSSILDDWKDIAEVAFVVYNSGIVQKRMVFDGTGTDNANWFSAAKLQYSSWSDLNGKPHFFSIAGDSLGERRFFVNHLYGGCDKDQGWFVAKDQHDKPCGWENVLTYPLFLYSNSSTFENWTTGKIAEADVVAIFVKFGSPHPQFG